MTQHKVLIMIGGCSLERGRDGRFKTKTPLCQYISDLCEQFDEVRLFAPLSSTNLFSGPLEHERLTIIPLNPRAAAHAVWSILTGPKKYLLLHLPNAGYFAPAIPFLKWRIISAGAYLGIDFTYEEKTRSFLRRQRTKAFQWAHRIVLRNCDFVSARGKYLAGLCLQLNPRVIETIPLGHMSAKGRATVERNLGSLLYVGKVVKRKGIDVLLKAFKKASDKSQGQMRLDVVGDGEDLEGS
jgi:glycosyltransferase involved in cell wall biosynthesis